MKKWERYLPLANVALCAVILVLLALDLFWPKWNIFLSEFVKYYLLLTCLVSAMNGARLYARMRRNRRRFRRRR